jgi:WD40 repeat protein
MFWASPAFAGDRLILRSMEHLYCIDGQPAAAGRGESPASTPPAPPTALSPLASFHAHTPTTSFLFFSRDGKQLISGGSDQLVQIWDMQSGTLERTFGKPGGAFKSGAFAPTKKLVVTGSNDHAVRVWDLESGKLNKTLEGHSNQVETIAVASDEKTIASGGYDRTFRLWNLETLKAAFTSPPQELAITRVAFSPDGKLVATGSGNIFEWRHAGEVKLWNAMTGEELALLPGHAACVNAVVFSPDGKQLATGTAEGMLRIWDIETRTEQSATSTGSGVRTIAFFADGESLAFGRWPGRVALFDVPSRRFEASYPEQQPREIMVDMVAISPDETLIASSGNDGTIHLWPVPELTRTGRHRMWKIPAAGSTTAADLVRKWKSPPGEGARTDKSGRKE